MSKVKSCPLLPSEASEYACCCVDSTYCPGEEGGVLIVDLQTRYQTRGTETQSAAANANRSLGAAVGSSILHLQLGNLCGILVRFDQLYILHAVHNENKALALLIMCVWNLCLAYINNLLLESIWVNTHFQEPCVIVLVQFVQCVIVQFLCNVLLPAWLE